MLTPDYHAAFANREFRRRFGESHGQRCYEFLFGRSEPCEICETYKVLQSKQPLEWEWTGPDGRDYEVRDVPFTDSDGSTLILEMGLDVTERKQAEKALRRSEAELKEAQRVARLGSWTMDLQSEQVTWSEELYRMLGMEPSLPAVPYSEQERIFTPESWTRLNTEIENTVRTGVPYELELETVLSDGSKGWMFARGEPVRDTTGAVTGLCGIALDIAERKRAERALRLLSVCNESLMRATEEESLLKQICDLTVTIGGYRMAWVGYPNADESKTVRVVAASGWEAGYLDAVNVTWDDGQERGHGPTGTAIREGRPTVCHDMMTDPRFAPWRDNALSRGYRSLLRCPSRATKNHWGQYRSTPPR